MKVVSFLIFLSSILFAQTESKVQLIPEYSSVVPGQEIDVAFEIQHPENWHSYYHYDGVGIGLPPEINWEPSESVSFSELAWPVPKPFEFYGMQAFGYEGTAYFITKVSISDSVKAGDTVSLNGTAEWQICDPTGCIGESEELTLTLTVADQAVRNQSYLSEKIKKSYPKGALTLEEIERTSAEIKLYSEQFENAENIFFYDFNGQTDAQVEQKIQRDNKGSYLSLQIDQGNDFRETPNPQLSHFKGILKIGSQAYTVNQEVSGEKATSSKVELVQKSEVEKAESTENFSALYNADQPINYVTLKESTPVTFWVALGGAFLGGMLLNLMPCVFPVLSLKVMSFVEQAGEDVWKVRLHGLFFTMGVLGSMWILAGVLFFLKLGLGQSINWGQQMGEPAFVAGIIIVLFVFGLNMAGVFELGTKLTGVGGNVSQKGYVGSLFSGVLTTVIATPCSGPFLGAAMGYTLEQPLIIAFVIFTFFAMGIALPYLLLSFFPALTNLLPRPGQWMETLKKILSFGMFGAAVFFLRTFGAQTGWEGVVGLITGLTIMGLGCYFYGHWSLPHIAKKWRYSLGFGLALLTVGFGLFTSWKATGYEAPKSNSNSAVTWEKWKPGIVEHYRAQGKQVWVDYTAQWCATCLWNKKTLLSSEEILQSIESNNLVLIKADLTNNDQTIAKDLSRVNRVQIPVNLFYPADEKEPAILLEELISVKKALEAIERTN